MTKPTHVRALEAVKCFEAAGKPVRQVVVDGASFRLTFGEETENDEYDLIDFNRKRR